jgi:DNA-directed RNA polymerase subunit RPC12/RpoP
MVLTNLSNQDVTYVNGDKIESKDIVQSDIVELGENKFNINLANIINAAIQLVPQSSISTPPPTVNIKHLEAVYNDYHLKSIERQKRGKKLGILASCSLIFTLGSTAIATLANQLGLGNIMEYLWILPVLGFIAMLISLYKRITDNSIEDADSAAKKFQAEYVCPNCGRFLGNMSYDLLKSQYAMQCPHCRSKFVD